MKKIYIHILLLSFISAGNAQELGIPDWYLQEIQSEAGTWIADNRKYKSDQEPFEYYVIEWEYGINKKSLIGKMYGLRNGENSEPFWEFRKYWDGEKKIPIVMQFGGDGTIGIGELKRKNEKETELLQVFTSPTGSQYRVGHRTLVIDSLSHVGSSFSVNEQNEWVENRSYTWTKKDL